MPLWVGWTLRRRSTTKVKAFSSIGPDTGTAFNTFVPTGRSDVMGQVGVFHGCQHHDDTGLVECPGGSHHPCVPVRDNDGESLGQTATMEQPEISRCHVKEPQRPLLVDLQGTWVGFQRSVDQRNTLRISGTRFELTIKDKTKHGVLKTCNSGIFVTLQDLPVDIAAEDCLLLQTPKGVLQFVRLPMDHALTPIPEVQVSTLV